jgi:hypothetical protein
MEPDYLLKCKSSVLAQQCEKIGEQILNYQKYIDPIGLVRSNRGGWQSKFDMSDGAIDFPFFDEWSSYLFNFIDSNYIDFIEKFYNRRVMHNPIEQSWIIRAWFNINWTGDWNHEHNHLPNGVDEFFYIPPEIKNDRELWLPMASGSFYITDSHNTFFVSKRSTIETTVEEEREYMDFKAGDTWIGNSSLIHGVSENKQNVPRISMSFNIEPTLEFK